MAEAYTASDVGRTWKIIAFNFNCIARSSNEISSAFCSATLRPGLDGQSLLATVTSHAPRNSRAGGGGATETGRYASPAAKSIAGINQMNADKIRIRAISG